MSFNTNDYQMALNNIQEKPMVDLLKKLVSIKSPFFHEDEIIAYLNKRLSKYDSLQTSIQNYEESKITGFKGQNLIVRYPGANNDKRLLLNAHIDTVILCDGWSVDPYSGCIQDGRLYGLGAVDMKAGLASCVFILETLASIGIKLNGEILFTAVSDEEGPYGLGTHYTIIDGITDNCDYAIIPEPSGVFSSGPDGYPCVCIGSRGTAVYNIEIKGKSAHGAQPGLGINAVEDAALLIKALRDNLDLGYHPKLGAGTMCITNFKGGEKYLLVPEEASFTIYRHTVEGDAEKALGEVQEIVDSLNLESQVFVKLRDLPHPDAYLQPWLVDDNTEVVQSIKRGCKQLLGKDLAISYMSSESDVNHLANRLKIPVAVFGAKGTNHHAADEYVDIDSFLETTRVLLYAIFDLLG